MAMSARPRPIFFATMGAPCYGKYLGHGDAGHIVRITSGSDLMSELGWGRRFGRLPICPEHRAPTDTDWGTKEKP